MQYVDNELQTVSMRSRSLKGAESNYPTYDRELLAIHDAFIHWRYYLDGNTFTVFTDHNPLTHLFKQDQLNSRQTRWMERLWSQKMTIQHVSGKEHVVADVLSRIKLNHIYVLNVEEELADLEEAYLQDSHFKTIWNLVKHGVKPSDGELIKSKARSYQKHFQIIDKRLFFKDNDQLRLCIPSGRIRDLILETHHDMPLGGHQGVTRTYDAIIKNFYFPRMKKVVERYCKSCISCQRNKAKNQPEIGLLNP